jgi:hypothetical protein
MYRTGALVGMTLESFSLSCSEQQTGRERRAWRPHPQAKGPFYEAMQRGVMIGGGRLARGGWDQH